MSITIEIPESDISPLLDSLNGVAVKAEPDLQGEAIVRLYQSIYLAANKPKQEMWVRDISPDGEVIGRLDIINDKYESFKDESEANKQKSEPELPNLIARRIALEDALNSMGTILDDGGDKTYKFLPWWFEFDGERIFAHTLGNLPQPLIKLIKSHE